MPLQSPRFVGDPVLEACMNGLHRMMAPEEGDAVRKVQQALIDLGFSIPGGADGVFGSDTGDAVTQFKLDHSLSPPDPVVGPGTITALDVDITALDAAPVPPLSGKDAVAFLNEAVRAHAVEVSAEHAVAEKLHGILSLMLFEQITHMDRDQSG